ncbi:MAG TPA: glycosyltransferase family 39 protein [Candidatus Eisenbacteria bacterium]|nr:glycosyltransferase family 39 protein [Candidatus Eisenbacteria bacterium]
MSVSRWSLAAALIVAAVLRLFRLGHQSLWIDEIFTWRAAAVGAPWTPTQMLEDVHGPLYSTLLHAWTSLAGGSEWALRFPSAILGVALVAAIAWLSGRWLGPATVVPAAWLAAGSPFLVWYAQEARNYTLLMLCMTVASALVLGQRGRAGVRGTVAYIAVAWAGLLSNLSFALAAPVHLRWWLAVPGSPALRVARVALVGIVLVVLASPWIPQIGRIWDWSRLEPSREAAPAEAPLRGETTFHAAALPFAAASIAGGYTLGPSLRALRAAPGMEALRPHVVSLAALALVFGTLAILGFRALHARGRLLEGLLWLLVPALIVSYFATQNFKVFHPRYLAVAVPGFIALLAAALTDLKPRARAAAALAIAALWAVSLQHHYFESRYAKEDMRGASALLAARAVPGERIVAANTEDLLFFYYRGPLPVVSYWLGWASDEARGDQRLDALVGDASGAWVVLSRGEDLDPRGAFARRLDERFPDAEQFRFEGVRVWHLRRAVPDGAPSTARS